MNFKRTIGFLGMAILAVTSLLLITELAPRSGRDSSRGVNVFQLSPDDITRITVEFGNEMPTLEMRRQDNAWLLTRPFQIDCDAVWMARFLDACESLRIRDAFNLEELTGIDREIRVLGLDTVSRNSPQLTIATEGKAVTCHFGATLPTSELAECYARLLPNDTVLTLPLFFKELLPKTASDVRTKRLIQEKPELITAMEWRAPGRPFVRLIHDQAAGWQVNQPVTMPLDDNHVTDVLKRLTQIPIVRYVWPNESSLNEALETDAAFRARLMEYGLDDENALQIQIRTLDRRNPVRIRFGKPFPEDTTLIYALLDRRQAVALVHRTALDLVGDDGIFALRNRRIFTGVGRMPALFSYRTGSTQVDLIQTNGQWMIHSPFENKAETAAVNELISAIADLRADLLTPTLNAVNISPDASTALASVHIEEPGRVTAFTLYKPEENGGFVHLRLGETGPDFSVPVTNIPPALLENSLDLSLVSRTMLSVPSGFIRRVTVTRGDETETISRDDEQSAWHLENSISQYLNEEVLETWINAFADLRAKEVVHLPGASREELAEFGLDTPRIAIRLDVADENALRKTLLLGRKLDSGDCYAMVRGHDLVYLLDAKAVQLFERPLSGE